MNLVPKGVSGSNNWNFASSVNHYGASQREISRKKENYMMKKSRSLTMSICLLCILGLVIMPLQQDSRILCKVMNLMVLS